MIGNLIEKYRQLPIPAKATIWFTICNLVLKGISFITVPIFTRLLSEDEYGKLSLFISFEQFFLIFSTWEIQNGAYQKGIFNYKQNEKDYTTATILLINIITTIFFLGIGVFLDPISNFTKIPKTLFPLLWAYFLVQPSYSCWLIRKRTKYEYKVAVVITILYTVFNLGSSLVGLYVIGKTAFVKYSSSLLSSILIYGIFYLSDICNVKSLYGKKKEIKDQWCFMIKFEGPLVLHSLSYLILNQADRVMIGKMVGNAEAAYYSIAYNLATVIILFQNSVNQTLLPWRYQMLEKKNYKEIKYNTNILLGAFACVILIFILLAPEIMKILFTSNYYEAIWCIPPISVGVFFMFLYTVFVNIETYFEVTKYIMYVSVTCGLINIGLNYLGIIFFDYISCAYVTLFSYILFGLGHYYFMKKVLKENGINVHEVIDGKAVLLISIAILIGTILTILLYDFWTIRWIIIAVMFFTFVIKRKSIGKIVLSLKGKG